MTDAVHRLTAAVADRYLIERELGAGGTATVYLAQDLKHHRPVAIKVLKPELAAVLGAERFLREIEISARLHHPHIVPLYDSGNAGDILYYVMPLVEGESLRDRLERDTQLPIDDALRIAREVADALSYAHSHAVIHRDIKPENILLASGHAMVADFGIALAVGAAGGERLTATGIAIGTPAYMSPEQAAGEKNLDGRSDLYALGCVLYEMLAGQPPFIGPTVESVVRQHMSVEPPSITNIRPAVPASVATALQRALAKTPADRFSPVALFAEALQGGTGVPGDPGTRGRSGAAVSRSRGPVLVAMATALTVLSWAGWRALRPDTPNITFATTRQVTREPGLEIQAAISPNGGEVAYASGSPQATHIEVRSVAGGRPLVLTGDWQGQQVAPRWTPNGQSIRFRQVWSTVLTRGMDHEAGVWTMPRMGGPAAAADPGATVAAAADRWLEQRADSFFARTADGHATLLFAGMADVHSAAWSPDGTRLVYVQGNPHYVEPYGWGNIAPSSIWVVTAGGTPVAITESSALNVSPAWLSNTELLFVSNRDGPRDLYAVTLGRTGRPRGAPVRVTTGLNAFSVSIAADGRTVAYDQFLLSRNIYSLPIPRTGSASLRDARAVTNVSQAVEGIDVSRDGQWLTFDSDLEGNQDIFVMPAMGGEPRPVTRDSGQDFRPRFSPDGREIVFYSTRSGAREIYVVNSDGTGEQRLTSDSAESMFPSFSPDGLRIAYFSTRTGSTYLLRRETIGAPWGSPELLATQALGARWSPDGTRLVFDFFGTTEAIGIVTLGGAVRTLMDGLVHGLHDLGNPEWAPDGLTIYFKASGADGGRGMYAIPAAGGIARRVVRFDDAQVFPVPVAIGNGRFYFVVGTAESDIYVMDLVRR